MTSGHLDPGPEALAECESDPLPALRRAASAMPRQPHDATDAVTALADALYLRWYTGMGDDGQGQSFLPDPSDPPIHAASLLGAFRAAHAEAGRLDDGWLVVSTSPDGVITAMRGEDARFLQPGQYLSLARPGVPPAPGELVAAVARLDRFDTERQLWWTFSRTPPTQPLGRVYLNPRPATAARTLQHVTEALTDARLSYQLKCPVTPQACRRTDAIVIYHDRERRDDAVRALLARWSRIDPLLDAREPPLTRTVAPGLAWADDDTRPDYSFGQFRCQALATAVLGAGRRWASADLEGRVGILVGGLRAAGIDAERPWLAAR